MPKAWNKSEWKERGEDPPPQVQEAVRQTVSRLSYRQLSRQPAWLFLDEEKRVIGSVRASSDVTARELFRKAAAREDPNGPRYFTRIIEAACWIRRAL